MSGSTGVSRKAVEAIDELTSVEIVGRLQSVQSIAQNTADDVETLALIAIRLDALGRTFHQ